MTQSLTDLLGEQPPASIAALPADRQAELAEVVASARRRQGEELRASFEATLQHVPFPLRVVVKRVLFG